MTLTLQRGSTLERPAPELMKPPSLTEPTPRPPSRRRWLVPVGLVVGAVAVGGVVLFQQRDDPEPALPTTEYQVETYTPTGALHTPGMLDGVFVLPGAPIPEYDGYTPQQMLSNDVLDGVFVIPDAPRLVYDTSATPGTRPTSGMVDGVYDPADPPQLPAAPDDYSGTIQRPGLPDGEWVRLPALYPCRISGPC